MQILITLLMLALSLQIPTPFTLTNCSQLTFLPMPKSLKCNLQNKQKYYVKDPCGIVYRIKKGKRGELGHLRELIWGQQRRSFGCRAVGIYGEDQGVGKDVGEFVVDIQAMDLALKSAFNQKEEAYTLKIDKDSALIQARHYVGLVRGLETFLQSITCGKKNSNCYMAALPIEIEDEPLFEYRGLLVDSSRHFLPMKILKETVDAMMYNKMNVLHWHIVDEDSFPLELQSHPELAEYGSFSIFERYSTKDVKEFIHYAMVRGVRVIPEIDTPGHAASWAKAPQNAGVACFLKNNFYQGPLDVTLHKTYELVKDVFKEVFQLFPDPYVHLGGDEVVLTCLANKTQFLKLQKIPESQLQLHYRKKQHSLLKSLNSSKNFLYWMHDQLTETPPESILHWWGKKHFVPPIPDRKLILSSSQNTGEFYINMGVGNHSGMPYHRFATWLDIYKINFGREISGFENRANVMGVVITLWSEVSNFYTHHTKIWVRSSSMAERAWTMEDHQAKPDFFRRILAHEKLMNRRGIPTSPITCQQCETHPQYCQSQNSTTNPVASIPTPAITNLQTNPA